MKIEDISQDYNSSRKCNVLIVFRGMIDNIILTKF